jgi:hypothetical protein
MQERHWYRAKIFHGEVHNAILHNNVTFFSHDSQHPNIEAHAYIKLKDVPTLNSKRHKVQGLVAQSSHSRFVQMICKWPNAGKSQG